MDLCVSRRTCGFRWLAGECAVVAEKLSLIWCGRPNAESRFSGPTSGFGFEAFAVGFAPKLASTSSAVFCRAIRLYVCVRTAEIDGERSNAQDVGVSPHKVQRELSQLKRRCWGVTFGVEDILVSSPVTSPRPSYLSCVKALSCFCDGLGQQLDDVYQGSRRTALRAEVGRFPSLERPTTSRHASHVAVNPARHQLPILKTFTGHFAALDACNTLGERNLSGAWVI